MKGRMTKCTFKFLFRYLAKLKVRTRMDARLQRTGALQASDAIGLEKGGNGGVAWALAQ